MEPLSKTRLDEELIEDNVEVATTLRRSKRIVKPKKSNESVYIEADAEVESAHSRVRSRRVLTPSPPTPGPSKKANRKPVIKLTERIKNWRQQKRENETYEEAEARRMRTRINNIKVRLIAQLKLPENELEARRKRAIEMNLERRKKRWANESSEERKARKKAVAEQKRLTRHRLAATETAEETARRKATEREKQRHYRHLRQARESAAQRAERREKERQCRLQYKQRKLTEKSSQPAEANSGSD